MMKKLLVLFIILVTSITIKAQTKDSVLNRFIYEWKDVPYKYGGKSKSGVDCSQLNKNLYRKVYKLDISNTCSNQWAETKRIKKAELKEGDLVFFKSTSSPSGWHCGTYIGNGMFFHSSGRKINVTVSSLNSAHYKKNYKGAGRYIKHSTK